MVPIDIKIKYCRKVIVILKFIIYLEFVILNFGFNKLYLIFSNQFWQERLGQITQFIYPLSAAKIVNFFDDFLLAQPDFLRRS